MREIPAGERAPLLGVYWRGDRGVNRALVVSIPFWRSRKPRYDVVSDTVVPGVHLRVAFIMFGRAWSKYWNPGFLHASTHWCRSHG